MNRWVIQQQWSDVLFLNWKVDASNLQKIIPFELDLYENSAVVSVVPFFMSGIRFPWVPHIPIISKLWELNLRTYVVHQGVPGIYFLTLDTPHRLGNWIGSSFFKLPYRHAEIQHSKIDSQYFLKSIGKNYQLNLDAEISDENVYDPFQRWVTERYHLFIKQSGSVIRGDVQHKKWITKNAKLKSYSGNFSDQYGVSLNSIPSSVYYAEGMKVRFAPFKNLK